MFVHDDSGVARSLVNDWRLLVLAVTAMVLLVGTSATQAAAAPAPVPCAPAGVANGLPNYNCQFYPAGDGLSGGSPVLSGDGTLVGYLRRGTNYVVCQRVGGTVTAGGYFNNNWAYTQADNLQFGWVNALYARGGDNNGAFGGGVAVGCNPSAGAPPAGTVTPPVNGSPPAVDKFAGSLAYILDEMRVNSRSTIVKRIKVRNNGDTLDRGTAAALWAKQVRPNGPWDHKPLLKRKFNLVANDDFYMDVPGTALRVFYDIWSNIHYGYVGRVAGFSKRALLVGQNLPGTGRHNKADDLKVEIGMNLYDKYPVSELTAARVQNAIVAQLGRLQSLDPGSVKPR